MKQSLIIIALFPQNSHSTYVILGKHLSADSRIFFKTDPGQARMTGLK